MRILGSIFVLLFLFFETPQLLAQYCSDCKIARDRRDGRIARADASLRAAELRSAEVLARHLPFGLHRAASSSSNERMLLQFEWITWYDDDLRVPIWVSYELTKAEAKRNRVRQDCFRVDPRLSSTDASNCEDYEEPLYDRGHVIPANDLKRRVTALDNSFLFSNMVPQLGNFNRIGKVWEKLERKVHYWAIEADGIYVITGSIFDRDGDGRRDSNSDARRMAPTNRVAVPSHFFKIILKIRPSGVMDTITFILPHDNRKNTGTDNYLKSKIRSIDDVEKVTDIDFFPEMEGAKQDELESGRAVSLSSWFTV